MSTVANSAFHSDVANSIAALRHHSGLAASILRVAPLVFDPTVKPVSYDPTNTKCIEEAFDLDRRLPTEQELDQLWITVADATDGPKVGPDALGRMLPLLFASRSSGRPETIPGRLAAIMEVVLFEAQLIHITPDMVALAVLTDLRTNRFPPEPSEFIAAIAKAGQQIAAVADGLVGLVTVRNSVDDLLVGAGLREPVPFSDDDLWGSA